MSKDIYLEKLGQKLTNRQIDRRQFMTNTLAAGVTVAAATALADKAQAATPKKGGMLTVGHAHGATTDPLDPGLYENGFQTSLTFGYNGYLTEVAPDGTLAPSIAESWQGSDDASSWTFKIRKGVEFHNGKSLTAQDVITSLNHHRGEDSTSAAKPLVEGIVDMKAEDSHTVRVDLETGNADFPFILTDYHLVIQPDKDGKIDWQSGVGAGPYKLDHYDAGVGADLSKHENHWNDAVGHLDAIKMLTLIDPNARTAAIVSGDVDIIDRVDLKTAGLLGRKPGVTLVQTDGTQHYTFPMRCDTAPYDNADVRRGLKHCFDRQELVDKILFGYGSVGNDIPLAKSQRFYNSELEQRSYDPDKAKFYFKKAGVTPTFDLSAADAAFPGAVEAAALIQNSAKAAGAEINIVREPNDGYWGDVWMNKDWCACYWGGRPIEDMMFSTAYATGASWNDSFWGNERFDELMVKARAEIDQDKRREMYYEMQQILWDDGGVVIPMFASYVAAVNDHVGMPEQRASNWDLDGDRWMERWWRT